ncbi:hypothetical protein F4806DRAFT_471578 [Annulohypoxylon nitens]|nr:hypothetical protein F4806DRAFT_471578 [Annulohypoxylon nitens]
MTSHMATNGQEIAIIGSGCRFPGDATSPSKLWALLRNPRPVASDVAPLRGYYHENGQYHGHANVKEAYLLAGERANQCFDAAFFNISPMEANVLDPQIRLLLETVYEALEAGGQTMDMLKGSDTAIYAGQMVNDYELLMARDYENLGRYHATGTSRAMLSNRISYFFDWHGPSLTMDTACSSSLVALHHAVQQIRSGSSRVAIVAGSNLIHDSMPFIAETNLQMLSPEGRSRMWDADANGYARGEGVAALVLKTRLAAEADGDHIECIIRETAVNQDGKTAGQTMPSSFAQSQLIQDCYERAGLDLANPIHRPQYFEAHGTGTPAGDPVEAEAISSALFPEGGTSSSPLFVGSIKTVIGHTEGAAGVAGILKASLAIQNAMIPPNLLFNRLNPRIKPFYDNLHLPTSLTCWPTVAKDSPRRASVNSFGFGGTNAHAILESYTPLDQHSQSPQVQRLTFIPFVFSATSEKSLKSYLSNFCNYLQENESLCDLRNIAYSMDARRTRLPVVTAIAASSVHELYTKIEQKLEISRADSRSCVGTREIRHEEDTRKPRVLGIFTGQGAQWAQMGRELLANSPASRSIIENLQRRLDRLPLADRPSWSLLDKLMEGNSCVMEATLSQPLCTAIQVLQVDLIRTAGIEFTAVLGHSSGEIAAAYAAGIISAEDAICISYYRGLHSRLSQGPKGQKGGMMAVGTSVDDAQDLLTFPEFMGRAYVAAINSATSVTLSGDYDAINELKIIFDDEQKFTRILRVDKAYHSHHMKRCSASYLKSLAALDIQIGPGHRCAWFSSVYGTEMNRHDSLKGPYWDSNMVKTVLFMQALDSAYDSVGPFDLAIEVGPHPTLKGPVLETIRNRIPDTIPYTGLFHRGVSATTSFSDGLGYAWMHLGKGAVNLQSYDEFVSGKQGAKLVKGLPVYAWDHDSEYWHESRYSRIVRMRPDPPHELLGHSTPNSTEQDMRWRHILRLSELQWLIGHQLQNAIVFPAAGYIVSVLEAALVLCKDASATLIEVLDIEVVSAIVFERDDSSVEVIISLTDILRNKDDVIQTEFKYHAAPVQGAGPLELKASGRMKIHLGKPGLNTLHSRPPHRPNLIPVDNHMFYESISKLEYQYTGQFRCLERLERKLGASTGFISITEPSRLLIHPAALDAAFQTTFLTYSAPNDGSQKSMYVPRRIRRVLVNPGVLLRGKNKKTTLAFDSAQSVVFPHANMVCDVDVYPEEFNHAVIQVQELECVPFSQQSVKDDREVFAKILWGVIDADAQLISKDGLEMPDKFDLAGLLDRIASFYLRHLDRDIPSDHPSRVQGPYQALFQLIPQLSAISCDGKLPVWRAEWEQDTPELLAAANNAFSGIIDMKLISEIGNNLVSIVKGEKTVMDIATSTRLIGEWCTNGFGVTTFTKYLSQILKQIVHRYPNMDILEIRGGVGFATKKVFDEIGPKFSSYTVTGPILGAPDMERSGVEAFSGKVTYHVSNNPTDLQSNGFKEASFDLVVVPFALYDVPDINEALCNIRRLLKPGGHLVALELLPSLGPFFNMVFRSFSQGRPIVEQASPLAVPPEKWDSLLRNAGFSGIDTNTPEDDAVPFTVFVSQAIDSRISFLREPLSPGFRGSIAETMIQDLLILGNDSLETAKLSNQLSITLKSYCGSLSACSILDFVDLDISPGTVVLCLADLGTSCFKKLTIAKWKALKKLVLHEGTLLWVTQGRLANNPHANMILGLLRCAARENQALDYLLLDIEDIHEIDHRVIAESLLRHKAASQWVRRDNIQWTIENELVLDGGKFLISRLVMDEEMNQRYNSVYREIRRRVRPQLYNVSIYASSSSWDTELEPLPRCQGGEDMRLKTTHSLLSPIRIGDFNFMFAVIGEDNTSGEKILSLSSTNTSHVCALRELSITIRVTEDSEGRLLWLTAHHLLVSVMLRGLSKGDKLLVHEPSPGLASIITEQGSLLGVQTTFTTTNFDISGASDSSWILVHPIASERTIKSLVHKGFSVFVDMAHGELGSTGDRIASTLPINCRKENVGSLIGDAASNPIVSHLEEIHNRLSKAVEWAIAALKVSPRPLWERVPTIGLDALPKSHKELTRLTVVKWDHSLNASVKMKPVDSQVSLSDNKTYWLVGLTGGLGLSLCEWMIQRGARHFVITSRNPNIEMAWLDEMRAKMVNVKVSACDITHPGEVVALHAEICSSMPPIAGVAQGAMVLEDTAIRDMTLEQLLRATEPKVEGSLHLNDLFQENTLDFFVFFSSVSSVTGNHGQANYAAANTFMASLAEQRRRRGLAASIIDIGAIFGVGYIAQARERLAISNVTMQTAAFAQTSERDFHQLFGEALLAGRPGSNSHIELVSGLRCINQREERQPVWRSWPRMSHFIKGYESLDGVGTMQTQANISVKARLAKAESREQIYDIIWDAFSKELSLYVQFEESKVDKEALSATHLDQMGIDSLIAVEIRNWFMKTLEVHIPVLKILNGGSLGGLVGIATKTIPPHLVPNLGGHTEELGSSASVTSQEVVEPLDSDLNSPIYPGQASSVGSDVDVDEAFPVTSGCSPAVLKSVPVSFTQARFYPSGLFLEDRVGLNHTAWARITGELDTERLQVAVRSLGQQHEILRTAFFDQDGKQMQHILKNTLLHLELQQITDDMQVEHIAMSIQKEHIYDIARGETVRLILLSRSKSENFLIAGIHPLVMDATSFQTFFRCLSLNYTQPCAKRKVKQFAEASGQRHADYAAGKFDFELQYWREVFSTPPAPLPLLTLAKVDERPVLKAYKNIRASCKIGLRTKEQILNICRRLRTTPFHFYLATLRALLLRYTVGGEDVTIAVAESGRGHSAEDMDVIGPLYNLVLVRLFSQTSTRFDDLLETTRDKVYAGLANSQFPFPILVKE